jgi:DNA-binding CsgD family transcriptional regulator
MRESERERETERERERERERSHGKIRSQIAKVWEEGWFT